MKKIIYSIAILAFAFVFAPAVSADENTEILYLTNYSNLYSVDLFDDGVTQRADLTQLHVMPYAQVLAMAATEDGSTLYMIDSGSSRFGYYDVAGDVFTDTGLIVNEAGSRISGIVLAAFSPAGDLIIASENDNVYRVDTNTAEAFSYGPVMNGGVPVNLAGADLVFTTDGTMYIWANGSRTGAPKGLYRVDDLSTMVGVYLGQADNSYFTGMAVRENGMGDLVGSDRINDAIKVISKTDSNIMGIYPLYVNGAPMTNYNAGDMTAGPIINPLIVTKTAYTYYEKVYDWTIEKTADQSELTLSQGQLFDVNYNIYVGSSITEGNWQVEGEISVYNPNIMPAVVTEISDIIDGSIPAVLNCEIVFPYALMPGETIVCTYSANLPDGSERVNTAIAYTEGVVPSGEGRAIVDFTEAIVERIDECVDIYDDNSPARPFGRACAGATPTEFNFQYVLSFGNDQEADVILECGANTHVNTASYITDDKRYSESSSWTVNANVSCDPGCTLTQGYWKTHSIYGPAPYNETWNGMEDDLFFLSMLSNYETLWTAPKGGNAYYILAHQYIAAKLNKLNGALVPVEVQEAMDMAEELFFFNTPFDVSGLKGKSGNAERQIWLNLAGVLGDFNEGTIGPGHCDE